MRVLLLCGLLLLAVPGAWAEVLRVDAMRLLPEATWRRGDAAREKEDGLYLLEWPISSLASDRPKVDLAPSGGVPEPGAPLTENPRGLALQVALPRRGTPLKTDAESFYDKLRKIWATQYGKNAEIGTIEISGVRWMTCRRPTGDGGAIVFQLATVYEGRAYSLLAFASPQATGLPKPIYDLLSGVNFGPEPRPWIATRVIAAQPGHDALEALVQGDAERLGQDGMLTGYGIEYSPPPDTANAGPGKRLSWFMDGFKWRNLVGRDERLPISLRGHLVASVPARLEGSPAAISIELRVAAESSTGVEAEVSLLDVCAPIAELDAALARLERGARAPLERLARERPASCPALPVSAPPRGLLARPGDTVAQPLVFSLPTGLPVAAGLSRVQIVTVRPRLVGNEDELGQNLLRQLGLYFVYAPE
ncbi:MAG: hypothetical protein PHD37_07335 [Gallionellaceae bacterium]|nr:hypothetical protein [Gallionellaceae bacterium]